jgi:hypothetical protein
MTGPKAAPVRRPRRSNSLKDIGRLLKASRTTYEGSRADRFKALAARLSDTEDAAYGNYFKIQTVNLFLRQFGIQLTANDRAFHIYEEWPGMDRRRVSGSVWDGRKPNSRALWQGLPLRSFDFRTNAPLLEERPAVGESFKACSHVPPRWNGGGLA